MSDKFPAFEDRLLEEVPKLRAFARSLCRQADAADDLVQETLLKAWEKQDSLRDDNAMRSWLFTILRNQFYAGSRRSKFEVQDVDGIHAETLSHSASQEQSIEFNETLTALETLPPDVRDAMVLVCVNELTYEQAAEVCGCVVGTLKSRINRGRNLLKQVVNNQSDDRDVCGPVGASAESDTTEPTTKRALAGRPVRNPMELEPA